MTANFALLCTNEELQKEPMSMQGFKVNYRISELCELVCLRDRTVRSGGNLFFCSTDHVFYMYALTGERCPM